MHKSLKYALILSLTLSAPMQASFSSPQMTPIISYLLSHTTPQAQSPAKYVLSSKYTQATSITIDVENALSYSIPNLPRWATLDSSSGVLSINPPGDLLGHQFFDVIAHTSSGDITLKKALRISLYVDESAFTQRSAFLDDETFEVVATTQDAITHTSPRFFPKTNGESCVVLAYYPSYSQNNQIFVVDLEDGQTKSVDTTLFAKDTVNLFKHVYLGNGISFVAWPTSVEGEDNTFMRYSTYDTNTNTWDADIIDVDTHLQHSETAYDEVQGTDGTVYVLASANKSGSLGGVKEINVSAKSARYYGDFATLGGVGQVAGDDNYVYVSTNKYGNGDLIAIKRSDSSRTTLKSNVDYTVFQRKHGVVFKNKSDLTWHYLYNGIVIDGQGDLNSNVPWGSDETDLYKASYYADIPSKIPGDWDNTKDHKVWDTSSMTPINGSDTAYFWYRYLPVEGKAFVKVSIKGIATQTAIQNRIMSLDNNTILTTNDAYLGYNIFDPKSKHLEHYQLAEGVSSIYTLTKKDNHSIVMNGYFGSPYIEYDFTKPIDNRINLAHNPNNTTEYLNPKFEGRIGSYANITKAYGSVFASNGEYYFSGKKVRSGTGGGVVAYNTVTKALTPIDSLASYNVHDLVRVGKYVIAASVGHNVVAPYRLSVIDTSTHEVVRYIEPEPSITLNQGRLTTDGEFVYALSISDDREKTYLFKYNPETNQFTERIYPFGTYMDTINDEGGTSFKYNEKDGFIYTTFGESAKGIFGVFSRIDPATLLAEPLKKSSSINAFNFDFFDESVYFLNGMHIRKLDSIAVQDGFNSLASTDVFSDVELAVGASDTQVVYEHDGTHNIGYSATGTSVGDAYYPLTIIHLNSIQSGTFELSFRLVVTSGTVKLKGGDYYLENSWGGQLYGISGTYGVGSYELKSNPIKTDNLKNINIFNASKDEPSFHIEVSNIHVNKY